MRELTGRRSAPQKCAAAIRFSVSATRANAFAESGHRLAVAARGDAKAVCNSRTYGVPAQHHGLRERARGHARALMQRRRHDGDEVLSEAGRHDTAPEVGKLLVR